MRILVIGSGGREHALVWKIAQSKLADKVFCAPGNGGIAGIAECLEIKADEIQRFIEFVRKEKIDLTVVGPEAPLTMGIADEFSKYKLPVFGPGRSASRLESSKVFAKELMNKYGIPTAACRVFDDADEADAYIEKSGAPCVGKDGRGVRITAKGGVGGRFCFCSNST
jgi:phosphoribosylamine---glycine ligase